MYRKELDFKLNSSDFPRAFMLYGDEDYQVEIYAKEILAKYGNDRLMLCFDEYDFNKAKTHLEQDSLFGDLNILHIKTDKKIPLKELKALFSLTLNSTLTYFVYELHDGDQKSIADHAKVFGDNFARFFAPSNEAEAVELLAKHAKKLGLNVTNNNLLSRIYNIQNQNLYLSAAELNKLAINHQILDDQTIANLIFSLNSISFEMLFAKILDCQNIQSDLAQFLEAQGYDETAFINALYRELSRLFKVYSVFRINPRAEFKEALGYNPPANVQKTLKSQANIFNNAMFLDIFMHLNSSDYELKKPNNKIDKRLFLFYSILKLQNIIAKHSKD